jgi:hypothetical protein
VAKYEDNTLRTLKVMIKVKVCGRQRQNDCLSFSSQRKDTKLKYVTSVTAAKV